MRIDKITIFLLLLLLLLVVDLKSRNQDYENQNNFNRFMIKKKQLVKEKAIFDNKEKIKKEISKVEKDIKENKARIFSDFMDITSIQTEIQKMIEISFKNEELEIDNIEWLDPVYKKSGEYVNIPVAFSVAGSPGRIMDGLNRLLKGEMILSIPIYTLRKYFRDKKLLELRATIVGFKKNEI